MPELRLRPAALRQQVADQRELRRGAAERIGLDPRLPRGDGGERVRTELERAAVWGVPLLPTERKREAVEPLQAVVVGPAQLVVDSRGGSTHRIRRFLLVYES